MNATNLEALGASRLAELLIEVSSGHAPIQRQLRLELAGALSPGEMAHQIRKQIITISRSRAFINWRSRKALLHDLNGLEKAIRDIAKIKPDDALELMWRYLALSDSIFARSDDSSGKLLGVFERACKSLAEIALQARPDPIQLADQTYDMLLANDYGQYDELLSCLASVLGSRGLEHLKVKMHALSHESPTTRSPEGNNPGTFDSIAHSAANLRFRQSRAKRALQEIADAQGDVDAFIAQFTIEQRRSPAISAEIATRLLRASRVAEAWETLETAVSRRANETTWLDEAWEDARIDVLEALGRSKDAQTARKSCFERALSAAHLRAYLRKLPAFDDVEAEEDALNHVANYPAVHAALAFLISWPALRRAAELITRRASELNGDNYEVLTPVAGALAHQYPLAATIALRAMIDFTLDESRPARYRHAANHLLECESLSSGIMDYGAYEPHALYVSGLRAVHGRKTSFWSLLESVN